MSLSVFLVPLAIGAVSASVGMNAKGVEELEIDVASLPQNETYFRLATKMKDEQLLQETLQNYGSSSEVENEEVTSKIGDAEIVFVKDSQDMYQAYFHESIAINDAEQFVHNIYEEYTRIVQRKTYEKLLTRAEDEGLILESEETNENESLVLTFEVKG